jgi:hypothetical protein
VQWPPGLQLYGELQRGKFVTAVNGNTIHPADVMSVPSLPGPCLVILDCPSLDYLPALQANPTLQALQQEAQQLQPLQQSPQQQQDGTPADAAAAAAAQAAAAPAAAANGAGQRQGGAAGDAEVRKRVVLVHVGPQQVSSSAAYVAWCAGFGPSADQLFISGGGQQVCTVRRAAQLQAQLNVIEPEVFQLGGFLASQGQQQQQQGQGQQGIKQQQQLGPAAAAAPQAAADAASSGSAGAAVIAAVGPAAVAASDGVVFRLMPPRMSGLCLQAVTPPPELETVQVCV